MTDYNVFISESIKRPGKVRIMSPYNEFFRQAVKSIGGKWDSSYWVVTMSREQAIDLIKKHYEIAGEFVTETGKREISTRAIAEKTNDFGDYEKAL